MPIYIFENIETREWVEEYRALEDREPKEGFRRVFTPVGFGGLATQQDEECVATMRTLAKMEDNLGRAELERRTGYSANQLKETWKPENAEKFKPVEVGD